MTEKQQNKVLECVTNNTLLNNINFKCNQNYTFKKTFFNAVLGRMEKGFTQQEVACFLNTTRKTIIELEKGNSNNLTLVLNYIHLFQHDFAENRKKQAYKKKFNSP